MGILAYADDFEDKVVSAGYKVNTLDYHWFELIAPYYRMGRTSANQHVSMYDSAYKRNNVIVGCPNYRYTMIWRPSSFRRRAAREIGSTCKSRSIRR